MPYADPQKQREYLNKYRQTSGWLEYKRSYNKEYNKTDKAKEKHRNYSRLRKRTDPQYRIACNLRTRLCVALMGGYKRGSAVKDLGCSVSELILWLEFRFRDGMAWENYGTLWEIDHKKPLSSFDLIDTEQFKEACHYTNLQPLLIEENRSKGASVCEL
jgi:hypothetical protein